MNQVELLPWIAFAVSAGSLILATMAWARHRRRRELIERLMMNHQLSAVEQVPPQVLERARRYRGRKCKVRLRNVLSGNDDEGRFYFMRRVVAGSQQELLFFESRRPTFLEHFHVEPYVPSRGRKARPASEEGDADRLRIEWIPQSDQLLDERTLSMGMRVMHHTSQLAESGSLLGVEIHHNQVLIHSTQPIELKDIPGFINVAGPLRRKLVASMLKASAKGAPSGPSPSTKQATLHQPDEEVVVLSGHRLV